MKKKDSLDKRDRLNWHGNKQNRCYRLQRALRHMAAAAAVVLAVMAGAAACGVMEQDRAENADAQTGEEADLPRDEAAWAEGRIDGQDDNDNGAWDAADGNGGTADQDASGGEETVDQNDASGSGMSDNDRLRGGESMSDNNSMSGNGSMSDNSMSDNDSMTGYGSMSDNDSEPDYGSMSDNSSMSDNDSGPDYGSMSDNSMSDNHLPDLGSMSDNDDTVLPETFEYPPNYLTLEMRRQICSSMEETAKENWADRLVIADNSIDFSDKKIACLGDSITEATNLLPLENYQQYTYPSILKELLGAEEVYNLGVGGSAVGRYWTDPFVERYIAIPKDVDIIIVMGGTNDGFCVTDDLFGRLGSREKRTFCGDLAELMYGLKRRYPGADIFFATPLPNIAQENARLENQSLIPQERFAEAIMALADAYGLQVIDLYNTNLLDSHNLEINANYVPDGVHPNQEGYRILAEHFAADLIRYYEGMQHE